VVRLKVGDFNGFCPSRNAYLDCSNVFSA
jgi:hypothetical protein